MLPERFLAPAGWRTGDFINPETGHKIHYGYVYPQNDAPPHAIVVCLGGLSEFSEKYYEIAHDMLDRGYAFWFLDWHYQGRSGRLPDYPMRRHSDGFSTDISDLNKLISDYIKPSASIPLVMLGHSMGGNLGLRYLAQYPDMFKAAAFTAPLLGIYNFKTPLKLLAMGIRLALPILGKKYVFAGSDWHEDMRAGDGKGMFSSDARRDILHKHWSKTEKDLQIGSVTFKWVIEALKSCAVLLKPQTAASIKIPVLIAAAGQDKIVDNASTQLFATRLPHGKFMTIDGAEHEILMESDAYRNAFFEAFDKLMEETKIASTDLPLNQRNIMQGFTKNKDRLSDRILFALELAIEQKDLELAESLNHCLDISMTRNTGGGEFVERRDYPLQIEDALRNLRQLKIKQ